MGWAKRRPVERAVAVEEQEHRVQFAPAPAPSHIPYRPIFFSTPNSRSPTGRCRRSAPTKRARNKLVITSSRSEYIHITPCLCAQPSRGAPPGRVPCRRLPSLPSAQPTSAPAPNSAHPAHPPQSWLCSPKAGRRQVPTEVRRLQGVMPCAELCDERATGLLKIPQAHQSVSGDRCSRCGMRDGEQHRQHHCDATTQHHGCGRRILFSWI